ncbi:MAG: protein-disulfide reductase DsbD family protein, partial [Rhodospirillales bacterium]|nr:protein-disulfide reductase DsbD family protein [Rhodospirillales bacterium]
MKQTTTSIAAFWVLAMAAGAAQSAESSTTPHAGASPWIKTEQTQVRLVSASSALGGADTVRLGLQFKLKPGWKIYWRAPGDAGFPPRLDWKKSENLSGAQIKWPAPTRFSVLGFETQGYKKEVIFPITARIVDPEKPLHLRAALNYLTCDEVCIPYQTNLSLDLNNGAAQATPSFQDINRYASRVPGDGTKHGLKITQAELAGPMGPLTKGIRNGMLRVLAGASTPFTTPDMFVEGPEEMVFSKPKPRISNKGRQVSILVPISVDGNGKVAGSALTFTLTDGARSAERKLSIGQGPPVSTPSSGGLFLAYSLPIILGLALLGGLILNLMPCVLPVLSLKLVGLVSHAGAETGTVRVSFLATSAGIVFSFLVIAGGLVGLRLAGEAVGWGIQLQHPWFLVGLTLIISLFAYNLWGLFEINLPYWLTNIVGTPGQAQGIGGNFATGAFATLLATPCSAPFLGTAVGFALAGGNWDTFAVFAALGVGMAAPYLLVAAFPGIASRLPKPGAWMVRVKQIMGGALALTGVWLLSVIAVQVSLGAALTLGAVMIALGGAFLARHYLDETRRWISGALVAALAIGAF